MGRSIPTAGVQLLPWLPAARECPAKPQVWPQGPPTASVRQTSAWAETLSSLALPSTRRHERVARSQVCPIVPLGGLKPKSASPGTERARRAATWGRTTSIRPFEGKKSGVGLLSVLRSNSMAISATVGSLRAAGDAGSGSALEPAAEQSGGLGSPSPFRLDDGWSGLAPDIACLAQMVVPSRRRRVQPSCLQRHEAQNLRSGARKLAHFNLTLCPWTTRVWRPGQLAQQCPEHVH